MIIRFGIQHLWYALFMIGGLVSLPVQARELPDFTVLAEQQGAAVVNISTTQKRSVRGVWPHNFELPELPENSPFLTCCGAFSGNTARKTTVVRIPVSKPSRSVRDSSFPRMATW